MQPIAHGGHHGSQMDDGPVTDIPAGCGIKTTTIRAQSSDFGCLEGTPM
jgi:hypothetical protein